MLTTNTSVLARRIWIAEDYHTLPYEAGWASEALFFVQAEGEHPNLTITVQVSPDGITWIPRGDSVDLTADEHLVEIGVTRFGNWLRLVAAGATESQQARVLIHLNLKG
ncbi:MAG: DUF6385 domain-containing protein [Beutenbergiaceae bacterium]